MTKPVYKIATAATLLTGVMLLGGCSFIEDYINQDKATRDEETDEITEEGNLDIFTLKVGDCITGDTEGELSEIPVVPCSSEHDQEVFYEFDLPEGDFPDDDGITSAVEEECVPAFGEFVGLEYESSTLDVGWLSPTQESWDQNGDRLVQCYVFDPAGAVTGTLEGAAR
jgi:hypothetical protein